MNKILTIALPTYNRSEKISNLFEFLNKEFRCLTKEELKNINIFISDNCSSDNTKEQILKSKIVQEQIVDYEYTCNSKNIGLLGNLKKIYSTTLGTYLWMMGDDDTYKPGIVKMVFDECKKDAYSYIFINHSTVKNGKVLQESVLEDLDDKRTDKAMLLDLYFKSNTVMMFMSACVYRSSLVNKFIQSHRVNLVTPCALSFYCASKGKSKYISQPMIIDVFDGISWEKYSFKVFFEQIPRLLLVLPFWGYNFYKCYKRALKLYLVRTKIRLKRYFKDEF